MERKSRKDIDLHCWKTWKQHLCFYHCYECWVVAADIKRYGLFLSPSIIVSELLFVPSNQLTQLRMKLQGKSIEPQSRWNHQLLDGAFALFWFYCSRWHVCKPDQRRALPEPYVTPLKGRSPRRGELVFFYFLPPRSDKFRSQCLLSASPSGPLRLHPVSYSNSTTSPVEMMAGTDGNGEAWQAAVSRHLILGVEPVSGCGRLTRSGQVGNCHNGAFRADQMAHQEAPSFYREDISPLYLGPAGLSSQRTKREKQTQTRCVSDHFLSDPTHSVYSSGWEMNKTCISHESTYNENS